MTKYDNKMISEVDTLLKKYSGKEPKLMLILAKKYDTSNPLNRIFISCVTEDHFNDYVALTTLYLSIFYPQHVGEAAELCLKNKGNEDRMFQKLSSNFLAINPLTMDRTRKTGEEIFDKPINYRQVLTTFYSEHDEEKVTDVDDILSKCVGKEAILFSVLAFKYSTTNALNDVFEERVKDMGCKDHLSLLQLYLSVYHPLCRSDARSMLLKYEGMEDELFSKLATKFQACNALDMMTCGNTGERSMETIVETAGETSSPVQVRRSARLHPVLQSPAVTP